MGKFPCSHSWIFHGFPELDPDAILGQQPGDKVMATEEERQRAWWLWQRRSARDKMRSIRRRIALSRRPIIILMLSGRQAICLSDFMKMEKKETAL
jgi:hypothetical protein